jgi:uncharacterized protein (TIGR03435 family)
MRWVESSFKNIVERSPGACVYLTEAEIGMTLKRLRATVMKEAVLFSAALAMIAGGMLHAQTVVGIWQGTLPIAENPQIVLKIVKADNGGLRGSFYRVDRFSGPIPLSAISFSAPNLSVASAFIQISYQARLSDDGKSMSGTWVQDKKNYPLTLALTPLENVWKHDSAPAPVWMAANADPAFEVATIKPSVPGATSRSFSLRTRRFAAKNSTLADLFKFAYKVRSRQIEGAPAWFEETRFDIAAEPDAEGQPSEDQYRVMLKKLLADRFQLKMHVVQKVFPVYALSVEKSPLHLDRSEPGVNQHGSIFTVEQNGQMLARFVDDSMPELADVLMNFIPERQIVDETGLTGRFDFTMSMPLNVLQSNDDNEKAAGFFEALKPLGFKLVPKKEPLDVYVIDRLEQPSGN